MLEPIATWNPKTQLWETETADLFLERRVPYSVTFPKSGMTRSGQLFPRPVLAPPIGGTEFSLLPTPITGDAKSTRNSTAVRHKVPPTGIHAGDTLLDAVSPLPTPTANDTGGVESEVGGRHTSGANRQAGLNTVVVRGLDSLLPTPRTSDTNGPGLHGSGGMDLRTAVTLFPTPCVSNSGGKQFGKYEAAVRRWEELTRTVPAPTVPGVRGKMLPRLNPEFSEWMMGWPLHWATGEDIGLTRIEQLKIIGNGVVSRQAFAALTDLVAA